MRDFTVDDIVKYDWPAGVDAVCRATGAKDVQIVGHCVGSLSLLMALLNGLQRVRSVIASQFSLHPVTHWFNYTKLDLDVVALIHRCVFGSSDGPTPALTNLRAP
jgi:pimeloyl-ACP methyl ester carboxylesterase